MTLPSMKYQVTIVQTLSVMALHYILQGNSKLHAHPYHFSCLVLTAPQKPDICWMHQSQLHKYIGDAV